MPARHSPGLRGIARTLAAALAGVILAVGLPAGVTGMGGSNPTASASPAATPSETPSPSPQPTPGLVTTSIAEARALPDGSAVRVAGLALTGSTFHDGGGYLADATGGIAIIVEDGSFEAGSTLLASGTIDDRFSQRTIRAPASGIVEVPDGVPIQAVAAVTGDVVEALEGRLVRVAATVVGTPTALSAGLAFTIDDGTGPARVIVWSATGIDTASWTAGARVELVGVVGQRDSSGSGGSGFRIQPRSRADVVRVQAPSPVPSPSPSPSPTLTPVPSAAPVVSTIPDARAASVGTSLTVRGVVTMPSGVVDLETAVIQDDGAAIVLRVDADTGAGGLRRGDLVEVDGVRSTKSGMETVRLTSVPRLVAAAAEPVPMRVTAADVREELEARVVRISGELPESARRAASGTVTFDLDDASGIVRVVLPAALLADDTELVAGVRVDVVGVLGQVTTGAEAGAGYRIWPRSSAEVHVLGFPADEAPQPTARAAASGSDAATVAPALRSASERTSALTAVGTVGLADLHIGATLVGGPWPELGIGGLLWDGDRLVAISAESAQALAVLGGLRPPAAIEVSGLRATGVEPVTGAPVVALDPATGGIARGSGPPASPSVVLPASGSGPRWVTLLGRLVRLRGQMALDTGRQEVALDVRCSDPKPPAAAIVGVTGIGVADPPRLIVPCDGIRAAPTLVRNERLVASPAVAASTPRPGSTAGAATAGIDPRRASAAGLLALAGLVLSGAAVARRRLAPAPDEADEAPQDPKLTLIRLRRDRGH